MHALTKQYGPLAAFAVFALAAGCGSPSGNPPRQDSAPPPDAPIVKTDTPVVVPDGPAMADTPTQVDTKIAVLDMAVATEVSTEAATVVDGPVQPGEVNPPGIDGATSESGSVDSASSSLDVGTKVRDVSAAVSDGPLDAAPDGFVPGDATQIVVNSGNTGVYSLGDGTWKIFYFDATAGQLYGISDLSGIVHGYVGTSPAVSPTSYQYVTSTDGTLAFTATAAQRYYIAVAVSGGWSSGSFQVADGGQLLALGANTVTLPAPETDNYYFFRFLISTGSTYGISVTGPTMPSIGLAVSPRAERASNGQFSAAAWGMSGPLPITDEAISAASVALSYSGYYFFFLRVSAATTLTVTLTRSP